MALVPMVLEESARGERSYDLFSRMLKDRIVFMTGEVEDHMANLVCAQLLWLESQDAEAPIYVYINSPGGSVTAGLSIYGTMKFLSCPVSTICLGQAASMGAYLLANGTKGQRFALRDSRIMIHQPSGGLNRSSATDMEIQVEEIKRLKTILTTRLSENCGLTYDEVYSACERDKFMSPEEAKEFGLIDHVLTNRAELKEILGK